MVKRDKLGSAPTPHSETTIEEPPIRPIVETTVVEKPLTKKKLL